VAEASFFAQKLREHHVQVGALVVNRLHPRFPAGTPDDARAEAVRLQGTALGRLQANLAELRAVAEAEREQLGPLIRAVDPAPVVAVPFLRGDVHDLDGLDEIARHLLAG
jgi:hypothetical protein